MWQCRKTEIQLQPLFFVIVGSILATNAVTVLLVENGGAVVCLQAAPRGPVVR